MDFFKRHAPWVYGLAPPVLLIGGYLLVLAPPANFPPEDAIVVVSRGTSVPDIAEQFSRAHIIKHPTVLVLALRASGASSRVQAGTYLFTAPVHALVVAYRLAAGAYGFPLVRITFPEGLTVRDMSEKVVEALPLLLAEDFISAGKSQEGYLFPDTYFFSPDASIESVITAMRNNFDVKIVSLLSGIQASGHSLADIITLASLVEKEARTDVNRRIVAGILWARLALGMPLQVDAVFGYIFNRDTYSPSFSDLTTESPYNLYLHKGLPPGPIANPGLASMEAVLYPTKTDYLYYLTDTDGVMRYATTYAEHQANQRTHLK